MRRSPNILLTEGPSHKRRAKLGDVGLARTLQMPPTVSDALQVRLSASCQPTSHSMPPCNSCHSVCGAMALRLDKCWIGWTCPWLGSCSCDCSLLALWPASGQGVMDWTGKQG